MANITPEDVLGSALVELHADLDTLKKDLDKAEQRVEDSAQKMGAEFVKEFAGGVGDFGRQLHADVIKPLIAFGKEAMAAGQVYDDAMDQIRIATGATGERLEGLEQNFRNLFESVPADAQTIANTLSDVAVRTGLTGQALEDMTRTLIRFSSLTKTDVSNNVQGATRLFAAWQVATEDQTKALDTIFKVSQQTGVGVGNLLRDLGRFGPTLKQFGLSMEESAVLLGSWEKNGINARVAIQGLQFAAREFVKDGKDVKQGLKDTVEQIKALGPGSEATAKAVQVFGKRAGPELAAAITSGRLATEDLLRAVQNSPETIDSAAKATEGFSERLQVLQNRALAAVEPLGTKLLGAGEALFNLFDRLPKPIQDTVITIGAFGSALAPIAFGMGSVIEKGGGLLTTVGKNKEAMDVATGVAGKFSGALRLLGSAALVAGTALAAWDLGTWIGEASGATDWIGKKLAYALYGVSEAEYEASNNARKLFEQQKALGQLAPQLAQAQQAIAQATGETGTAASKATDGTTNYKKALQDAYDELKDLTAAEKEQLAAAIKVGAKVEELTAEFGLSATAISLFKQENKESKKAVDEHAEAIKNLKKQFAGGKEIADAKAWVDALASLDTTWAGALKKLTGEERETLNRVLKDAVERYKLLGQTAPPIYERLIGMTEKLVNKLQDLPKTLALIQAPQLSLDSGAALGSSLGKWFEAGMTAVPQKLEPTIKYVTDEVTGQIVRYIKTSDKWVPMDAPTFADKLFAGLGGAEFGQLIGNTIMQALTGGGDIGKSVGGLLGQTLGNNLGKMAATHFGGMFGSVLGSLIPGLGTLIGSIGGEWIAKGLSKLFKTEQKHVNDLRDEFIATFGPEGTGLGSGFNNLAAKLTEITGQAGGGDLFQKLINADSVEKWEAAMAAVIKVLDEYEKKQKDITDAAIASGEEQRAQIEETKAKLVAEMKTLDDELTALNASEAPEEHMGHVERATRDRIARQKAILEAQLKAISDAAKTTADAAADSGETAAGDNADAWKESFKQLLLDGKLTYDELREIFGRGIKLPIEGDLRLPNEGRGVPMPDLPEFKGGGFIDAPESGALAILHGREIITPIDRVADAFGGSGDVEALIHAMERMSRPSLNISPSFTGSNLNEQRAYVRDEFVPLLLSVLRDSSAYRNELFAMNPQR